MYIEVIGFPNSGKTSLVNFVSNAIMADPKDTTTSYGAKDTEIVKVCGLKDFTFKLRDLPGHNIKSTDNAGVNNKGENII